MASNHVLSLLCNLDATLSQSRGPKSEGDHMSRRVSMAALAAVVALTGCRTGQPIYDSSHSNHQAAGTIGGILRAGEGGEPVGGRTVTAVSLADAAARHSATTNVSGGFSIKVPPGKYRLEVDLMEGERILRSPGTIDINKSDLDANLEVVIGR
jgi:carboxypeptidase family protein